MKTSALKLVIKEAVKEAIQEELKEILLEAVKTPKVITNSNPIPVVETKTSPNVPQQPTMTAEQKREAYKNILGETGATYNSQYAQSFKPNPNMDVGNGALPAGEVDMSQIMGLMSKK